MWNIGNQLAKQWCDAIPNLSLPAFNGQINLLKRMIEGAKKNEIVVFGNLFLNFILSKNLRYQFFF
jgi:hypothetical protein